MFRTKLTKKGQITIPAEYRTEMNLRTGVVVEIKRIDSRILIQRPRGDIMDLKCKWSNIPSKIFEDMKKAWGRWK